jgi:hypothetical protein
MTPRAAFLLLAMAASLIFSLWVPWKIRVRLKGDDRYLSWRYALVFDEHGFDARIMAQHAGDRLGLAISPADVEAMVDYPRIYVTLAAIVVVTAIGWLFFGELNRPPPA